MYEALKIEFQRVYAQAEFDSFHAKKAHEEQEKALIEAHKIIEQLRAEIKAEKEDRHLQQMQWQMLEQEKQETLRR